MHSFFMHRGRGPLVSVLIPSRERPIGLLRAIDSLWSLAEDKSLVQFIVKVDDDDVETIAVLEDLRQRLPSLDLQFFASPRGLGYKDLHLFVNDMASRATGDWLLLFNDDATMTTQNWEQILRRNVFIRPWFGAWDISLLWLTTKNSDAKQFPLLRRRVVEILGHFSRSPHNDTWTIHLMTFLRMAWQAESIVVNHPKSSDKGDWATHARMCRRGFDSEPTIHSIEAKRLVCQDAEKILSYLAKLEGESVWTDKPNEAGWWFWDSNGGAEGNVVLMDKSGKSWTCLADKTGSIREMEMVEPDGGRFTLINPI